MAVFLVQHRWLVQLVESAVHFHALKALLAQFQKLLAVFTLAVANDRRQQIAACALFQRHDAIHHVLHLLCFNRQTGRGAEWCARAGKQQAQIIVDLGNCTDGRTGVLRGRFLLNRNRRRKARDMVHIRLFHHIEKLPRIGRERLDVTPLSFRIDRVESQRRFARS